MDEVTLKNFQENWCIIILANPCKHWFVIQYKQLYFFRQGIAPKMNPATILGHIQLVHMHPDVSCGADASICPSFPARRSHHFQERTDNFHQMSSSPHPFHLPPPHSSSVRHLLPRTPWQLTRREGIRIAARWFAAVSSFSDLMRPPRWCWLNSAFLGWRFSLHLRHCL